MLLEIHNDRRQDWVAIALCNCVFRNHFFSLELVCDIWKSLTPCSLGIQ